MRWSVRAGEHEAGPYEEAELEELVRKGLRDALVRPEGGSWVHLSASPFARLVAKAPDQSHFGMKVAVAAFAVFVLWVAWNMFGHPSVIVVH
ncbi:MAG TPA: hypothetical protein VL494_13740 [Steroidobacteraceae bacterium]|jgi:hypothetical protein|nr:hypothetical protein [Steroidobacteraceae bacterium]